MNTEGALIGNPSPASGTRTARTTPQWTKVLSLVGRLSNIHRHWLNDSVVVIKKPPNLGQTLSFLSQNRAQTPTFLKPKFKKSSETGGLEGRSPPDGVVPPPLSKLQHVLPRNRLFGTEGLDFQAKK